MGYPDDLSARKLRVLNSNSWDLLVRQTDARFRDLEEKAGLDAVVRDSVLARGLQVIEDQLSPTVAEAANRAAEITLAARDLGLLFRASSVSNLTVGEGVKTFIVAEGERNRFAAPLFVIAARTDDATIWMAGQVTGWNVETGALTVDVTNTRGAGSHAAWQISIAGVPPEALPAQSADNVTVAPSGGIAATNVQAALEELDAEKADAADLAALDAEKADAADLAALDAVVATKATSADIDAAINALVTGAPAALNTLDELANALGDDANFAATVTTSLAGKAPTARAISAAGLATGGGDLTADRTITVTAASQVEAQAGTDNTKAMTPLRVAQAISALSPAPNLSTYAQFTTSTDANLNDYPIGSIVLVSTTTSKNRNSSFIIYRSGTSALSDEAGTQLTGTWRARGSTGVLALAQRVA